MRIFAEEVAGKHTLKVICGKLKNLKPDYNTFKDHNSCGSWPEEPDLNTFSRTLRRSANHTDQLIYFFITQVIFKNVILFYTDYKIKVTQPLRAVGLRCAGSGSSGVVSGRQATPPPEPVSSSDASTSCRLSQPMKLILFLSVCLRASTQVAIPPSLAVQ